MTRVAISNGFILFCLHVLGLLLPGISLSFQRSFVYTQRHKTQHFHRRSFVAMTASSAYDISSKNGVHKLSFEVAGKKMSFETGKIGRQASGAVVTRYDDTILYSTVCLEREHKPVDFTPLRVDYFARYSAVGRTVGAFHRRDCRGDDSEILVARLIDRPIRPMIADGWQHETQILTWVLSYDKKQGPEPLSISSSAAAMCISEVPMSKPVAGVEVGRIDGEFVINPTKQQLKNSTLSLTVAGTKDGILMIEGEASFLSEEEMMQALTLGHSAIGQICDAIEAFQKVAGKPKKIDTLRKSPTHLLDEMDALFGKDLTAALSISDKHERGEAVGKVEEMIKAKYGNEGMSAAAVTSANVNADPEADLVADEVDVVVVASEEAVATPIVSEIVKEEDEASEIYPLSTSLPIGHSRTGYDAVDVSIAIKKLLIRRLRQKILNTGLRSDGRSVEDVRPISIETDFLPHAHGSALFTRGETQALATATLGSKAMEAKFETLDENSSKRFYLQYRFPPSSVGEVGRVGGVNRREVGHGNLAERALLPCIPDMSLFPYSIRAESLITESCGSSSMATVCGCCLAMLDAGIPLKSPVAGVAMGLILGEKASDTPVILTDILGLEDALGTMDFKVAGNTAGISSFQLDIKTEGLTLDLLGKSLDQAKRGRLKILNEMTSALSSHRELKPTIPRILEFQIDPEAIGKVIGPKGKTIQGLIETHALTNINLDDTGIVQIESYNATKNEEVKGIITAMALEVKEKDSKRGAGRRGNGNAGGDGVAAGSEGEKVELGPPPEEGIIYRDCPVKGIHSFGLFVEVLPGYQGLVHISELEVKRISGSLESAGYSVGQLLDVKYLGKNEKGQMRLSRKAVLMRDKPSTATGAPVKSETKVSLSMQAESAYSESPPSQ